MVANVVDVFQERKAQLLAALLEHIQISFIALFFAVLIAIPLGIYLTNKKKIAESIIGISAVLQTIPSLALLGLLIPLFGIGKVPAIIALVVYALLPILRNTYTGINEVDPSLKEAALAMGMNRSKRLVKVELPLAMPVMMAGIRTAMVLIVGTATLAALIGAGGLGDIILLGIDRNNTALILIGAIPAAILALIFDVALKKLESLSFKKTITTLSLISLAALVMIFFPLLSSKQQDEIVIAGKLGAEPEILINMYKLLIEQETDLTVTLKPGLGKTSFVFNALKSGSIDIYPEFTGTAISEFLKEEAINNNQEDVYLQAKEGMQEQFDMVMLSPMNYNNTYALAVSEELAESYQLQKISDLKPIEQKVKAGFTLEFNDREDGYVGIQKRYGIAFTTLATMEPKLRYQAIQSGDINLLDAYSTDSEIRQYKLRVLEDDQALFPPYQGAPLLRKETLIDYPEIGEALNQLADHITDDEMREMNYQVNVEGKLAAEVAKEYLVKIGLLK
ncbi:MULTISPECIES: osmoprotectant update ABC transporter permease/substrate-binding subunit OpuFB [Lysinibacillus]|uniref:osmoprotectant update ABC transporter permease/substrate-binding subunit OpuFB n=1 Tax=Lysinibacillus TaxID=400634 RepID=UPI0006CA2303|nr:MULTISPECIES: osmoprotectant update ABC transporter permease/substrate-binding subunit OpuFB [Lysinibacillus]MED3795996.1 osmoprotectant update ABC transporter permease/substrate-binding subunit OpuFB [Lysinibacillus capsici]MED3874046.1 osmoprotectant update ABC transporter permease/substrate-binding subunit OpuFB [Lysinibacillus capsici]TBV89877.1 ABC transporter permease/substrate-binding protein [Lysinibacillus sp. OL1]WPK07091.1 osmoprotectant update ABC transporter permease/substrate-b